MESVEAVRIPSRKIRAIHSLRVNVKSLMYESMAIRSEARKAAPAYRNRLTLHRRTVVREESRHAQLALAFLRGRPYRQVESNSRTPIEVSRIVNKIKKQDYHEVSANQVQEWITAP